MADETLERLSDDVKLPFEERCQHAYEYHRCTWPGGRPDSLLARRRGRRRLGEARARVRVEEVEALRIDRQP